MVNHSALEPIVQLFRRKALKYGAKFRELSKKPVLKTRGYCPICDRPATFIARDAWLRDNFKCNRCRSIPRERALMDVIQQRFPDWRNMRIHESSPVKRGASLKLASECKDYIPSQLFEGISHGELVNGVRCEDLEELSFEDESIDLHITQDVFEHIMHPEKAFVHIARTLKRNGAHIFTVPLVNKNEATRRRAQLNSDGSVRHLEPPSYHANPVDPQGSLVTIDWGFDIVDHISGACGLNTEIVHLDDLKKGIRAEYIEVLVTTKC